MNIITLLSIFSEWGLVALRVAFGVVFFAHGFSKFKNLKETQEWFQSIGYKPGAFWGTLVALVETLGSLAIILGFYTQSAAVLLAVVMINSTIWRMRQGHKLVGGYELDLALLGIALFLATNGAGIYSLDAYWNL